MNIKKLKENSTLIGYIGSAITFISLFLPFAVVKIGYGFGDISASFSDYGKCWIVILGIIIAAAMMFVRLGRLSAIPTGIGAVVFLIEAFDVIGTDGVSIGFGLIAGIIGFVIMGAYAYLYSRKTDNGKFSMEFDKVKAMANSAKEGAKKASDSKKSTDANTKFCSSCGANIPKDTKFCSSCGETQK